MAASVFDLVSDELERRTGLAKLEARGTVRLALKQAGLDAAGVTASQMQVMLERVMPDELRSRGVESPERVCQAIRTALTAARPEDRPDDRESPEAIFRRLAKG